MSRLEFWQRAYLIALEAAVERHSSVVLASHTARSVADVAVEDQDAEFGAQIDEAES